MNQQQWIEKLKKEGFKDIFVCPNEPNTDFGEHTHHKHKELLFTTISKMTDYV